MPEARALSPAENARRIQANLQERAAAADVSAVVLVEGLSDCYALTVLAARLGMNLEDRGVAVVPMGGATNIRRFLSIFGPQGSDVELAGLCDVAEEDLFRRSLEQADVARMADRPAMEAAGFFVSRDDLEDELIRSLGTARVEQVIEEQGELESLRKMQNEPFHRTRSHEQQVHRFMGVRSGRKYRYARLLAEALDLTRLPEPLQRVLSSLR